jgi:thiamine biosynthesis lipoprotein
MPARRHRFVAIGTRWTITISSALSDAEWHNLQSTLHDRIEEFDRCYSRFRADSLVSQMATKAGRYELPADGYPLLQFYERLYHATDGAVTPLIGQVMTDLGYDAAYSFHARATTAPPAWDDIIEYDEQSITLHQPALLDFGAAGKGYLVDLLGGLLAAEDVTDFTIDAGGDILQRGAEAINVGLENPQNVSEAIGTIELKNSSLCASAGSRRAWGSYHHIIDPQSLSSPSETLATWVMADDCMTADGLATALFFVPASQLARDFRFAYATLHDDMSLEQSRNFPAKIFTAA